MGQTDRTTGQGVTNSTQVSTVALWNGTDTFTSFTFYTSQTTIMSLKWWIKIQTGNGRCENLFEILNKTFSKFYSPYEHLAVDKIIIILGKGHFSDNAYSRTTNVLASKFTKYVTRLDTHMIRQFILYLMGVRKFHIEILDSSTWIIYWKWWCKSVDTSITQQMLVFLGPDSDATKMSCAKCEWWDDTKRF